jgi:HSP20 family molecular chaperone IbpA
MSKEVTKKSEQGNGQDGSGIETTRGTRVYSPATDICETETGVVIAVDMPGVGPDDVDIQLEKRVLTIRGRGRQVRPDGYRAIYAEYGEGDYERVFSLSGEIDEEGIKAAVRHGVLMLELPKVEPARPKRIAVNAA